MPVFECFFCDIVYHAPVTTVVRSVYANTGRIAEFALYLASQIYTPSVYRLFSAAVASEYRFPAVMRLRTSAEVLYQIESTPLVYDDCCV